MTPFCKLIWKLLTLLSSVDFFISLTRGFYFVFVFSRYRFQVLNCIPPPVSSSTYSKENSSFFSQHSSSISGFSVSVEVATILPIGGAGASGLTLIPLCPSITV